MEDNKYKLTTKELQSDLNLNWYDFGARMQDEQIGRWVTQDHKAELYLGTSPYVYALNQPTNAIDPDGNLVIFINGMHGGSGGGPAYWRGNTDLYSKAASQFHNNSENYYVSKYVEFDVAVMDQLKDHNAIYRDGAIGGLWRLDNFARDPLSASDRYNAGKERGAADAKILIDNLLRDKNGNISETIKIITHSMGGVYGSGYLAALKEYIKTLPIAEQQQIKITLVADFDPFQAGSIDADKNIKTLQFKHKNNLNVLGLGWLANEDENGAEHVPTDIHDKSDHSIFSFFYDINSLEEGTYMWNGTTWIKQ